MSEFEEYIKVNYPRDYERQKRIYPDQRVEELYSEDYKMWQHQQAIIDDLKAQLNNMEACYIEKKKEVEAVDAVLMNWRDEYTEYTHQHECTVDAVLRTCIAELEQALRGGND